MRTSAFHTQTSRHLRSSTTWDRRLAGRKVATVPADPGAKIDPGRTMPLEGVFPIKASACEKFVDKQIIIPLSYLAKRAQTLAMPQRGLEINSPAVCAQPAFRERAVQVPGTKGDQ